MKINGIILMMGIAVSLISCKKTDNIKYVSRIDVSQITQTSALIKVAGMPVNSGATYTVGFLYGGVKEATYVPSGTKGGSEISVQDGFYEILMEDLIPGAVYTISPYISIEGGRVYSETTAEFTAQAPVDPIGQIGPGGGIIFYDDGFGGGMEVYPTAWTNEWGGYSQNMSGCLQTFGSGANNTQLILNQISDPSSAAMMCDSCTAGGKTDWFLPSRAEIEALYTNLVLTDILPAENAYYWSSSYESGSLTRSFAMHMGNGAAFTRLRYELYYVWPVRSF